MKKFLAMALTLCLVLSLAPVVFAEGDYYNKEGYRICDEEITVTSAANFGLKIDVEENLCWQQWRERFGLKFDFTFYSGEDWKTQLNLMFASDELPDILSNASMSNAEMADYGSQGYFVNLLDYADLLPNMFKYFEEHPEYRAACTSPDGAIYGVKMIINCTVNKIARTFINREWLERVGKEQPFTIDELYDVLVAFKENDANGNGDPNDEIPLGYCASGTGRTVTSLLAAYGFNTDTWSGYNFMQVDDEGKVYLADTSEAYKAFLTFMRKCYAEGLIAEEAFTLTGQEVNALCAADRLGYYATGSAPFVMAAEAGVDISYDAAFLGVMGLTSEYNDKPFLSVPSGIDSNFLIAISSESPYIEALVRWIDYLFSDEGQIMGFNGYEGVTFDYKWDDLLQANVIDIYQPEGYASKDEFRQYKATFNGPFKLVNGDPTRNVLWYDTPTETLKNEEVIKKWGWMALLAYASRRDGLEHVTCFPTECFTFTEDELSKLSTLSVDIGNYLQVAFADFILGNKDIEADWAAHIATLESAGLNEYVAIYQAAYDRYVAANE